MIFRLFASHGSASTICHNSNETCVQRMLKKHLLLFADIIPGQIEITPTDTPIKNIGII